jgi:hypothetical protein
MRKPWLTIPQRISFRFLLILKQKTPGKYSTFIKKIGPSPPLQLSLFLNKLKLSAMLRHFQRQGGQRNEKKRILGIMLGDFSSDSESELGRMHDYRCFQQLFLGRD